MFKLTEEQLVQVKAFEKEQDAKRIEEMLESDDPFILDLAKDGIAYYGATGGAITYSFTPTSIGVIETVKHGYTKEELDLTDYDMF